MRDSNLNEEFLRKLRKIFYLVVIVGLINLEMSAIFYFNKFEKPAIWISIYAIISRHLWGIQGVILILVVLFKAIRKTSLSGVKQNRHCNVFILYFLQHG